MLMGSPPVPSGRGSREAELRGSDSANVGGNPCLTYSIATASTCSLASAAAYYICTIEKNKLISIAGLINYVNMFKINSYWFISWMVKINMFQY